MGLSDSGLALSMTWQMFAVTLNGIDVNPQFVTPDTLRYNSVVDDTWLLTKGALFGPGNSSFAYSNGVSVVASEESLCFRQIAGTISEKDVLCDRLAARYLDAGLPGTWFSALTEFGILVRIDPESDEMGDSELSGFAGSLRFEGVYPDDLRTFLSYLINGRRLSINLSVDATEEDADSLKCYGSVHRYLDEALSESSLIDGDERFPAFIGDWPADYHDVVGAIEKYIRAVMKIGGSHGR